MSSVERSIMSLSRRVLIRRFTVFALHHLCSWKTRKCGTILTSIGYALLQHFHFLGSLASILSMQVTTSLPGMLAKGRSLVEVRWVTLMLRVWMMNPLQSLLRTTGCYLAMTTLIRPCLQMSYFRLFCPSVLSYTTGSFVPYYRAIPIMLPNQFPLFKFTFNIRPLIIKSIGMW